MASRGYEFYLRVLKVSLTSERNSNIVQFRNGHVSQNACHKNVRKLGCKVIKEK